MVDLENFWLVPGYPECKNAKPIVNTIDIPCPVCGGKVIVRKTKRRKNFYVCENNPDNCEYISWNKPKIGEKWTKQMEDEKVTKSKKIRKNKIKKKK